MTQVSNFKFDIQSMNSHGSGALQQQKPINVKRCSFCDLAVIRVLLFELEKNIYTDKEKKQNKKQTNKQTKNP